MVAKFVGYQRYSGEYQGRPYSGVRFFFLESGEFRGLVGSKASSYKASPTLNIPNLDECIDQQVRVYFDRYGRVDDLILAVY